MQAGVPEWEVIDEEGMVTEREKAGKSGHSMSGPFGGRLASFPGLRPKREAYIARLFMRMREK